MRVQLCVCLPERESSIAEQPPADFSHKQSQCSTEHSLFIDSVDSKTLILLSRPPPYGDHPWESNCVCVCMREVVGWYRQTYLYTVYSEALSCPSLYAEHSLCADHFIIGSILLIHDNRSVSPHTEKVDC